MLFAILPLPHVSPPAGSRYLERDLATGFGACWVHRRGGEARRGGRRGGMGVGAGGGSGSGQQRRSETERRHSGRSAPGQGCAHERHGRMEFCAKHRSARIRYFQGPRHPMHARVHFVALAHTSANPTAPAPAPQGTALSAPRQHTAPSSSATARATSGEHFCTRVAGWCEGKRPSADARALGPPEPCDRMRWRRARARRTQRAAARARRALQKMSQAPRAGAHGRARWAISPRALFPSTARAASVQAGATRPP